MNAVEVLFEAFRRLVGRRLRVRRIWLRLSQDDMAEKAEVSRNLASAIERSAQVLDATRLRRVVVRAARVFGALAAYGRGEAAPGVHLELELALRAGSDRTRIRRAAHDRAASCTSPFGTAWAGCGRPSSRCATPTPKTGARSTT